MTVFPGGPQDDIKYTATAPDGSVAVFNDPTDPNYVGMARFTGLDSSDIREAIDPRSASDGAIQGLNFRGGRPVVGTVEIVASSTLDRNTKFQRLKRAMNALRRDGTLDFTPDGSIPQRCYYRLNQPIRRNDEPGWKTTAQFPLMAADPYLYSQAQHSLTVSGGGDATVVNQGDGYSAPTITVTLTSPSNVVVANNSTGEAVSLSGTDPTNIISYVSQFGTPGSGNSQFSAPGGVAIDASGNVYVADYNNHHVKKFNSSGVYQQTFGSGTGGFSNGQLYHPQDVAVDGSGNVYVVDYGGSPSQYGRVQKFNSAGVYQAKSTTAMGGAAMQMGGIAVDATPTVHVVDRGNSTVRTFSSSLGASTGSYGSAGSGNGQFNQPMGIAIASAGAPHVVDLNNKRVQKFAPGSPPTYNAQFNMAGADGANFGEAPFGIGMDSSNNMYVSDVNSMNVAKFTAGGVYQTKFGSFGGAPGQFYLPGFLEARGTDLWVPDTNNNRVERFSTTTASGIIVVNNSVAAVTTNTGVNLFQFVDLPNTTWWALVAGDNTVEVTGPGVSSWTIKWRDAWL